MDTGLFSHSPQEWRNTLLIVDDEQNVRNSLQRLLRKESYDIVLASGPEEALDIVRENNIGVVLSDHAMPGMTGLDLLRKVRQLDPKTIRMILTGHADLGMAIQAINEGEVMKFYTKPWDDHQIKADMRLAFSHLRLQTEFERVLKSLQTKNQLLEYLEQEHPGITHVERNDSGAIVISAKEV